MPSGNGLHEEMERRAIECFDRAMHDVELVDLRLRQVLHEYFAWATTTSMSSYPHDANEVPGDRLWLQVQEAKVFTNLRQAQAFLAGASRLGCRLGLEKFGSGLDSFQLLAHFKPAFLKIDRSFTEDQARMTEHQQKIRDIAERARSDGMQTIAEFVQDAATMSFLFSVGVDYVEGFFLAPPTATMTYDFS
jgi:EAL domain-containing protein (putative c-di-GMP-specific phosphodiesterase class I)